MTSEKQAKREKISVDRDEYEFLQAIAETVDEFLNAPFPGVREAALEWLKDTVGDELGDDNTKQRQARIEDSDCEECRRFLIEAFAWKERQRRVEPAQVLTLHRHSDKIN